MSTVLDSQRGGTPSGRRVRRWVAALGIAVVVLAPVVYLGASWYVYQTLGEVSGECHPIDARNTPQLFVAPFLDPDALVAMRMPRPVDAAFPTRDPAHPDVELAAWWVPGDDPAGPAVIVMHGAGSCRREPNVLVPAAMLHRHGFGVLLLDARDHGDSDDEDLRFAGGTEEYLDVLGGRDWLVAQGVPPDRIGLLGMSFGAATVLITGGEEPAIRAVWADSSFADIHEAMRDRLTLFGYPTILEPGAQLVARVIAGDDLSSKSPLGAVAAYGGRHVALVHGAEDADLPARYATTLRDAALAAGASVDVFWIVPGAGHTESVYLEPDEYEARMAGFFGSTLGAP